MRPSVRARACLLLTDIRFERRDNAEGKDGAGVNPRAWSFACCSPSVVALSAAACSLRESVNSNNEDRAEGSHGPRECMSCRGSGQVISSLGGTPSKVTCPWWGGGGVRVPGTDAQAGWPAEAAGAAVDASAEPAA